MKIVWNDTEHRFDTQPVTGPTWKDDLAIIRDTGLKTNGPPNWIWFTRRVAVLKKLRDSKPPSGLTISALALEHFKQLGEQEERNKQAKKEFKKAKKAVGNTRDQKGIGHGEFDYYDIPPSELPIADRPASPIYTGPVCTSCGGSVYFYERQNPFLCLWCDIHSDF